MENMLLDLGNFVSPQVLEVVINCCNLLHMRLYGVIFAAGFAFQISQVSEQLVLWSLKTPQHANVFCAHLLFAEFYEHGY